MAEGEFSSDLSSRILPDHLIRAAAPILRGGTYLLQNQHAAQDPGLQSCVPTQRYLPPRLPQAGSAKNSAINFIAALEMAEPQQLAGGELRPFLWTQLLR